MGLKRQTAEILPFDAQLAPENREFYQGVFRKHNLALCRFVRRMGVSDDLAQDIAQDAYLRVVRQNEPHKLASSPRAYLYRVAVNLLRDRLRRERLHRQLVGETLMEADILTIVPTPERELQQKESLATLKAAIRELNPEERRILLLHRFSNLTCRDIGRMLGLPQRTVERRLSSALEFCRSRVGRV